MSRTKQAGKNFLQHVREYGSSCPHCQCLVAVVAVEGEWDNGTTIRRQAQCAWGHKWIQEFRLVEAYPLRKDRSRARATTRQSKTIDDEEKP